MKVVMIGSGNVATHLGPQIRNAGHSITQVFSRERSNAEILADALQCSAINDLAAIDRTADLYLIMVADDAIEDIVRDMGRVEGVVAHTAGAVDLDVLDPASSSTGVLWTPQTFSKERIPDLSSAPFCIQANNERSLELLKSIADQISSDVRVVSEAQRKAAHLAAVIGANFSNYMYTLATKVLEEKGLDLSIIGPLLKETLEKALDIGAEKGQTGPARRGDRKVIEDHLRSLEDHPELAHIYEELSSAIEKHYGG